MGGGGGSGVPSATMLPVGVTDRRCVLMLESTVRPGVGPRGVAWSMGCKENSSGANSSGAMRGACANGVDANMVAVRGW